MRRFIASVVLAIALLTSGVVVTQASLVGMAYADDGCDVGTQTALGTVDTCGKRSVGEHRADCHPSSPTPVPSFVTPARSATLNPRKPQRILSKQDSAGSSRSAVIVVFQRVPIRSSRCSRQAASSGICEPSARKAASSRSALSSSPFSRKARDS